MGRPQSDPELYLDIEKCYFQGYEEFVLNSQTNLRSILAKLIGKWWGFSLLISE